MSFKRILIAVDESALAAHAADAGIELAKLLQAEVAFIHVVDTSAATGALEIGVSADMVVAMAEQEGRNLLLAFRERAETSPPALEFFEIGKPTAKILDAAKSWPADLVVIGSHGRSGVERLLLGSVAESVARHASCPVLVVRAPECP